MQHGRRWGHCDPLHARKTVKVFWRLSPPDAEEDTAASQEPQAPDEAYERKYGGGPQQSSEEVVATLTGSGREANFVDAVLRNGNGESCVHEDPGSAQMGTERLVRVFECLLSALDGRNVRSQCTLDGGLELTVNIRLWQIRLFNDSMLAIGGLFGLG